MSRTPAWLLRLLALAAVFVAITLWRSHVVDIPLRQVNHFLTNRIVTSAVVFVVVAAVDAVRRTPPGQRHRPRVVWETVRARWTAARLVLAWSALLCYHVIYFCYRNLKSWDVLNTPRDTFLSDLDRWLFLGHSPAVLLHDVFGQGWAAGVLIFIYETFPKLVTVSVPAAVALCEEISEGAVFVASMSWAWILGTVSYYAIPSLGPFYERPQDFAGLPTTEVTRTQALYLVQRDQLLTDRGAHDAFASVSAFASLHIAVTTVMTLMAVYYGLRRTTIVMTVFLAGTLLATVYLGWHYVVDDIAGLAIGFASVFLGRLMAARRPAEERSEARVA